MTGVDSERSTSSAAASALTGLDMLVDGLRELGPDRSVSSVMQLITGVAVASLAGADEAGLTLLTADRFTTKAPTSDVPTTVDALQYEHGGPCLDAVLDDEDGTVIQVDDLRTEQRWPGFASAAVEQTPVLSMLSYCLCLDRGEPIGSLNLYATKPHAFDPEAVQAGKRLAAYAATGLAFAIAQAKARNLEIALDSNRDIGAAIGILMSQHRVTRDQAFDLLAAASQHSHRKLRDLADDVIQTGVLDQPTRC